MASIMDGIKALLTDVQAEIDQLNETRKGLQILIDMKPPNLKQMPKRKYHKRQPYKARATAEPAAKPTGKTKGGTWVKIIARLLGKEEIPMRPREIMEALEAEGYKISGPTLYAALRKACDAEALVRTDVGYVLSAEKSKDD